MYLTAFRGHGRTVKSIASAVYLTNIVQGVLLTSKVFASFAGVVDLAAALVPLNTRPLVAPMCSMIGGSIYAHLRHSQPN